MFAVREQADDFRTGVVDTTKRRDPRFCLWFHIRAAYAKIPAFQIGRAEFFRLEDVLDFLKQVFRRRGMLA